MWRREKLISGLTALRSNRVEPKYAENGDKGFN